MNDTIESVMSFINENTTILISICIFLIFVLVIYLIRSSSKSKKLDEKLALEKIRTKNIVQDHKDLMKQEQKKKFEDAIINDNDNKEEPEEKQIEVKVEDLSAESSEQAEKTEIDEEEATEKEVDVLYKNDKKLSEILIGDIEKQPEGKLDESIVKEDDDIERLDSVEELDAIMKKLNDYDNQSKND